MRAILILGMMLTSLLVGESAQVRGPVSYGGHAGPNGAIAYVYDSDGDMTGDDPFPVVANKSSWHV